MEPRERIYVLVVEDSPTDALLVREELATRPQFMLKTVPRLGDAVEHLQTQPVDVVLLDLGLPDSDGMHTLTEVRRQAPRLPIVVLTGNEDEDVGLQALHAGAQDYVVKRDLVGVNVARVLLYAIERQRNKKTIAETTARLEAIVNSAMDAILALDADERIVLFNPAAELMFGRPGSSLHDTSIESLIAGGDHARFEKHLRTLTEQRDVDDTSNRLLSVTGVRADGAEFPLEVSVARKQIGGEVFLTTILRDVTERQRAEAARRDRTLQAALSADVGGAFTHGGSLRDMLQACARSMAKNLTVAAVRMWTVTAEQHVLELQAWVGVGDEHEPEVRRVRMGECEIGLIAQDRKPFITNALASHPELHDRAWVEREGLTAMAGYPLVVDDHIVGVMAAFDHKPIDEEATTRMDTVGSTIALSITRMQAEAHRDRLVAVLEASPDLVALADTQGLPLFMNRAGRTMLGYGEADDLSQTPLSRYYPDWALRVIEDEGIPTATRKGAWVGESVLLARDGREIPVSQVIISHKDEHGTPRFLSTIMRDLREHRRLQQQLQQSQKLEALGHLAGGVAHDFNNVLTVISGYSQMLLAKLTPTDPKWEGIQAIHDAGERAATMTRQLLTFSRKSVLEPKVLSLNEIVKHIEVLLRRLIGEDIALTTSLESGLARVKVDRGQLEQVLMNLCINARDAMPHGGRLTIETRNLELNHEYCQLHPGSVPGPSVQLAVSDTGHGMRPEVKTQIFDPFFTTKEEGRGTGLGLAVVHGIVKQSGGHIDVYSEPDIGTSFKIYFPAIMKDARAPVGEPKSRENVYGTESILLVEDDPLVRNIALLALQLHGYKVVTAIDGRNALQVMESYKDTIDLVVTDLVMPEMSGRQLAERLGTRFPQIKTLFMSGYTDDAVIRHGLVQEEVEFIQKPFSPVGLATKVREALDRRKAKP